MRAHLVELITYRLRAKLWLSFLLGLVADVLVLVPLAALSPAKHPESAGALIAAATGAIAGPLAGLLTAASGGVVFYLAAGGHESATGALISSAIWMSTALLSGLSVDALRRSRSSQQKLELALAREEAAREAHEETVRLSETLTTALQPRLPARHADLDVFTVYKPGQRLLGLGGDFLDAVALPDGRLALVIGDVAGHGPLAAALGASLRAGWRSLILEGADPISLMHALDAVVDLEANDDVFATACLAWVEPALSRVTLLSAGHPRPLVIAAGVTPLDVPAHAPLGLGVAEPWEITSFELSFESADDCSLFFYTDGLIEGLAAPGDRERFGEHRLMASVAGLNGQAMGARTLDRLVRMIERANGAPLPDDVTALALVRRRAA